jgi:hypothetical protein
MTHQDNIQLLRVCAQDLGWTEQAHGKRGGYVLHSPRPYRQRIVLPPRGSLRESMMRSHMQKLVKYADPLARAAFFASRDQDFIDSIDWEKYIAPLPPIAPGERLDEYGPKDAIEIASSAIAAEEVETPRELVGESPWLAHKSPSINGGTRYTSHAVIERRWSDGSTDYRCAWEGCEFIHTNPRAVASHYGRSKSHQGNWEDAVKDTVRDPEYVEPKFARGPIDRVARWKRRLEEAAAGLDQRADDFLERLAERMVELAGDTNSEPHEPLSAEQTLERIRRLVDGGAYIAAQQQAQDMTEQVVRLEQELRDTQWLVEDAQARADKFRVRWEHLKEGMLDTLVQTENDDDHTESED